MNTYPVVVNVMDNTHALAVGVAGTSITQAMTMDTAIQVVQGEHYAGSTHVTPTDTAQTLATAGLFVDEDIVVDPVPQNYGRITWDGATLTVS